MRIGMDLRLAAYREGGIPRYGRSLLAALARRAPTEEFVALQHRRGPEPLVTASNVRTATLWTPPHHHWEQALLPLELWGQRLDLLHSPDFIPPFYRRCPAVITVHDLAFLRFPEILTPDAARYYGRVHRAVASAEGVIAVSETTKADMVELLGAPPERITVVYHGIAPAFHPHATREVPQAGQGACGRRNCFDSGLEAQAHRRRRADREGVPETYMLWVGTREPRKGLPVLLEALSLARRRLPRQLSTLVLVGADGWLESRLVDRARELGVLDLLIFTGPAEQEDLAEWYRHAWVFLFPSLYEGFGLPPLEAMACGTPVIASDAPAMPEILGDAAVLTPARDPGALAEAIVALAHDADQRAALRTKGLARAAHFSWDDAADKTLAVYREAIRR